MQTKIKFRKIGAFLWWGAYQVAENFLYRSHIKGYSVKCDQYNLSEDGMLVVYKYYTWDGPTGAIKTRDFVAGSCIHDVFCELINNGHLPKSEQCKVDEEMLLINRTQDMPAIRRAWTYLAVRWHMLTKKKKFIPTIHEVIIS